MVAHRLGRRAAHLMMKAIRGHFRGHQRSSEAISGHQRSSTNLDVAPRTDSCRCHVAALPGHLKREVPSRKWNSRSTPGSLLCQMSVDFWNELPSWQISIFAKMAPSPPFASGASMLRMCKCLRTHLVLGCSNVNPKPALPGRRRCERMKSRYLMRSANHTQSRHNHTQSRRNQDGSSRNTMRLQSPMPCSAAMHCRRWQGSARPRCADGDFAPSARSTHNLERSARPRRSASAPQGCLASCRGHGCAFAYAP